MPTYIVRVADDFIRPRTEEYEIEADDPQQAERLALLKRGLGFVASVREKNPSRLKMVALELAILERDEAREEAMRLRAVIQNLLAWKDDLTTTAEPTAWVDARDALLP